MSQVIFIFSDWSWIKQIIVFSTLFYCLGKQILKGSAWSFEWWMGAWVKMPGFNVFSRSVKIINLNFFPTHREIYKLEKNQQAFSREVILRFFSSLVKSTKLCMSFFKPQVILPSKFALIFSIMTHNPSVFFSSNIIYFGQKEPMKVQILTLLSVGSKLAKFLMSFFKAEVSSFSNFASLFIVMTHNPSVLSWFKYNILSTKVVHQIVNFQTCQCSH